MRDIQNRTRILKLLEILLQETDETHTLALDDLVRKLQVELGEDYKPDRKVIKSDLETFDDLGYGIDEFVGKQGKKYYSIPDRQFELFELRLLVDAVLSSRFITKEQSKALINKLKKLTSKYHAKELPNQVFYQSAMKIDNETTQYTIDQIHRALPHDNMIAFQYGRYNMKKEFHLNNKWYLIKPYALLWHNDSYYLIGQYEEEEEFRHYRIDRIRSLTIQPETFKRKQIDMTAYVQKSFHMYSGKEAYIKVNFKKELAGAIIDKFGLDVDMKPLNDEYFQLRTDAKISDGLVSWILMWGASAQVISPPELVERVQQQCLAMAELYASTIR